MATTGAKIAGTGSSVARGTNTAWTNPGNITADDGTVASCNSGTTGSAYLRASNFGFNIPANSLIQGFTVVVDMAESSTGSETVSVQLVGAAATAIGTAKTFPANGTTLTLYTVPTTGGSTDLWGTSGLTATDINDTDFGVYVWYQTTHNTTVDYISINVSYTPPISGSFAITETGNDSASISGKVLVSGALSATETGADTAAFSGNVRNAAITGSFAATESGSDTYSISGKVLVSGSLSATESGTDSASISGKVLVSGALSAQESGTDTASISGKVIVSGSLAAQESGQDSAEFAGNVLVSGALDATESGQDVAHFISSSATITGTLEATESGSDSAAFAGVVPTQQKLSGGFSPGPRSAIKAAAQRILALVSEVKPTKTVAKITKKLEEVLAQEKPQAKTVEALATQAIEELIKQQKLAEYVRDIQNIRNFINELRVIKQSVQKAAETRRKIAEAQRLQAEQDDEEALLLLT